MSVSLIVAGIPVPQGSKSVTKRGLMYEANKALIPWRGRVEVAAKHAMQGRELFTGPVDISIAFAMPRPKSARRDFPSVKPDLDKLIRAVGDALTGVVYKDDALVVHLDCIKHYTTTEPHARIYIHEAQPWPDAYTAWDMLNHRRFRS